MPAALLKGRISFIVRVLTDHLLAKKHCRYSREDQLEQITMQLNATEWRIATIAGHLFDHECK